MLRMRLIAWSVGSVGAVLMLTLSLQPSVVAKQPAGNPPAEKGAEELTRGPVHEAFGKPVTFNAKAGLKINKEPPAPVEEMPPDEKPEGDNVAWIPGYWSYDDERTDFVWISGFWRTMPPERTWVSGYWKKAEDGHVWVSGYWASAATKDTEYLPNPPESIENGASTKPPTANHIWVPGCWVWHDTRYVWRPGYWLVNQAGWIWMPAHYNWTPCGYVYVDGYWDWSVKRRGVLFAPVYIDRVYYTRPGYVYSPAIAIDGEVVTEHFFVRGAYGHYYFGDYYDTTYVSFGITPWFTFHATRYCYDPIYCSYECHYRTVDPGWSARIQVDFRYRSDHVDARPARTYAQQQVIINNNTKIVNKTVINNGNVTNNKNVAMARPLKEMSQDKNSEMKFQKVEPDKRQKISQEAKEVRHATAQRTQLESDAAAKAPKGGNGQPMKLARPDTPVVAKASNDNDKGKAPPPLPPSAKQDREKIAQSGGNNHDGKDNKNDGRHNDDKARVGANQDDKGKNDRSRANDKDDKKDVTGSRGNDGQKMDKDGRGQGQGQGQGQNQGQGAGGNKPPNSNPPKTPPKTPPKSDKDKDKKKDK